MAKKQPTKFFGVGVDMEDILRFKTLGKNKKFLNKIFTKNELDYCLKKKDFFSHLATRFAGKEAAIKAINSAGDFKAGLWNCQDIEICNAKNGLPQIKLLKPDLKNLRAKISLSHCGDKAIAVVIIAGE